MIDFIAVKRAIQQSSRTGSLMFYEFILVCESLWATKRTLKQTAIQVGL